MALTKRPSSTSPINQHGRKKISPQFMPNRAYVFEHGTLAVGQQEFTSAQFDALVRYNERHGCAFFRVVHQKLHFNSFVGVLQVGTLAIEIIPKDEIPDHPSHLKWQNAL